MRALSGWRARSTISGLGTTPPLSPSIQGVVVVVGGSDSTCLAAAAPFSSVALVCGRNDAAAEPREALLRYGAGVALCHLGVTQGNVSGNIYRHKSR